jgi:hypothetical protein
LYNELVHVAEEERLSGGVRTEQRLTLVRLEDQIGLASRNRQTSRSGRQRHRQPHVSMLNLPAHMKPQPPKQWWIEKQQEMARRAEVEAPSEDALTDRWQNDMTRKQRIQAAESHKRSQEKLAKRVEEVKSGAKTDLRTKKHVERGGHLSHLTAASAAAVDKASQIEHNQRVCDEGETRVTAVGGCCIDDCVFAKNMLADSRMVEFAHIDRTTKDGNVTDLSGEEADMEAAKTRRLCMAHHHEETFTEMGDTRFSNLKPGVIRDLAADKLAVGCQMPSHAMMPYAKLVDAMEDDIRHAFLERSCNSTLTTSQREALNRKSIAAVRMQELESETAMVNCAFCHGMWTICENGSLEFDTGKSKKQFARMKIEFPEFVKFFEQETVGFDWKAETKRLRKVMSEGAKKRGQQRKMK